ncbi:hypothetical protein LAZ67_17002341 [Cordylochernes scorpioides]|uniref:LRRCT domain-containing protein n=1 Tax=Cordylochernes scorpioides TaxID=51811 RepID=A0ABY6LDW2_9ARAC|nr:hypothetical protein LAZ67_17002341 [Cordylochernes scorpioides]
METRSVYNTKKEETKVDDPAKLQLNDPRQERPKCAKITDLIKENPRTTLLELEQDTGISKTTIGRIVTKDLKLKNTPAKFIPRFLTNEQKLCRLATCENMLEMTRTDPEWKDKIITGDETWVYDYDPETKRQYAEWRGQVGARPVGNRFSVMRWRATLLGCLLLPAVAWALCPAELLICRCGSLGGIYVTNCTDTGITDASVLHNLPPETEILIFRGNELRDLPYNLLGRDASYPNLRSIDLSDNRIQTIRGRSFHGVSHVRTLSLDHNDLYVVGKDLHPRVFSNFENLELLSLRNAFTDRLPSSQYIPNLRSIFSESSLTLLRVLNLELNEIVEFTDSNVMCDLLSLKQLLLGENRMNGQIGLNLTCLRDLTTLDISHNRFHRLASADLAHFDSLRGPLRLNITHNPWICDCELAETLHWMHKTSIQIMAAGELRCSSHGPNAGKTLLSLKFEDLECPGSLVSIWIGVISGVILFVLILTLMYRKREQIVQCLGSSPVVGKLTYISLERSDVPTEVNV